MDRIEGAHQRGSLEAKFRLTKASQPVLQCLEGDDSSPLSPVRTSEELMSSGTIVPSEDPAQAPIEFLRIHNELDSKTTSPEKQWPIVLLSQSFHVLSNQGKGTKLGLEQEGSVLIQGGGRKRCHSLSIQEASISVQGKRRSPNLEELDPQCLRDEMGKYREKKLKSAVKLQKALRSWLARTAHRQKKQQRALHKITACLDEYYYRSKKRLAFWVIKRHFSSKKARILYLFLVYTVTYIQKHWRGFTCRVKYLLYKQGIAQLSTLALGWKIRRIFLCPRVKSTIRIIKDTQDVLSEIEHTDPLYPQVLAQLANSKQKLSSLVAELAYTGKWVPSEYSVINSSLSFLSMNKPLEQPIRPLVGGYSIVTETKSEPFVTYPPVRPKFTFLRKSAKSLYNPCQRVKENSQFNTVSVREVPPSVLTEEAKIQPFLKRKSRSVKPNQVKRAVRSRVDCWSRTPLKPASLPKTVFIDLSKVRVLESTVARLSSSHIDLVTFFLDRELRARDSQIPHCSFESRLVTAFSASSFKRLLHLLEQEYSHLSSG